MREEAGDEFYTLGDMRPGMAFLVLADVWSHCSYYMVIKVIRHGVDKTTVSYVHVRDGIVSILNGPAVSNALRVWKKVSRV